MRYHVMITVSEILPAVREMEQEKEENQATRRADRALQE
jgi:hypothetical protein